jgi:hypothetical protein
MTHCPTDEEIGVALISRPLAKSRICNYLLTEYDRSLPGDNPAGPVSIEHILPDTYSETGPWSQVFTESQHKNVKDTLANLLPLSNPLNSSIQASIFDVKKQRYIDESMFKAPRYLANRFNEWTRESINIRQKN